MSKRRDIPPSDMNPETEKGNDFESVEEKGKDGDSKGFEQIGTLVRIRDHEVTLRQHSPIMEWLEGREVEFKYWKDVNFRYWDIPVEE